MPNVQAPHLQSLASALPQLSSAFGAADKYARDVAQALNSALVLGDSLQIFTPYTQSKPLVVPSDWQPLVYKNSWVDYDGGTTGRYRKDFTGRVEVSARVKNGTSATATIATLPAAYCPGQMFLTATRGSAAFASLEIDTSGDIHFPDGGSTLDGSVNCSFFCSDFSAYIPSCFPFDVLWPKQYPPTAVIAQCADANQTSPKAFATLLPDWGTVTKGGQTMIHVRNIPGLLPSTSYSVTLAVL